MLKITKCTRRVKTFNPWNFDRESFDEFELGGISISKETANRLIDSGEYVFDSTEYGNVYYKRKSD